MNKRFCSICAVALAGFLAAVSAMAQSGYYKAITNLNPVGYWPMHEVEAAAPGDIETNYGTLGLLGTAFYPDWPGGTLTNAFYRQTNGPLAASGDNDPATYFLGKAGNTGNPTNSLYVPHTSPLSTLTPPFSVECWTWGTSSTLNDYYVWSQSGYEGLNAGASGGGAGKVCGIQLYWGPTQLSVQYYDNSSAVASLNEADNFGQWDYVVVTVNSATNLTIYVNGNQVGSKSIAGAYSPDYWTPFTVGNGRGNGRAANAAVDEVAVYTTNLGLSDIQAKYAAATTAGSSPSYFQLVTNDTPVIYLRMDAPPYTPPPVASWPILTNFGSVAANGVYTPGTMPGIVAGPYNTNGAPFAGLPANVPQLGGVSSFGDAGYAAAYNPIGAVPFSVAVMFRGNPADNRYETIVGHSTNSWAINMTTLGNLACQIGTNTASAITSAGVYNDGNWHQAVEVYTPASVATLTGTNALYVDGVLDTVVTTVTTNGFGPGSSLDAMLGTDPQYTNSPLGVGRQFSGQVCEAALFPSALTTTQVQALYNASGVVPIITQQPVSASVNLNGAFTNTVAAVGSILGYQWYENNTAIPGQTGTSLVLDPVTTADNSANYYAVVSNSYTSVTSAVVSLTVNAGATISSQTPTTVEVFAGSTPTLFMNAVGTGTLQYQWTSNGNVISGATGSSYTVVNPGATATYSGKVFNAYGTNSMSPVMLTVLADPGAPYPRAVLASHPMDYWRLDEANGSMVGYDYAGGNNGVYTNTDLGFAGYSSQFDPQSDPTETSANFGSTTTNDSFMGSVPSFVNFGTPVDTSAEFSVEAWIHPNGGVPADAGLVSLGYGGAEQFCLDLASTTNLLNFFVRDASGTAFSALSSFAPTDGNWHHVAGVCDEVHGAIYLYADGQLAASAFIPAGSGLLASTNALTIGSRQEGLGTQFDDQISGAIDDVAVYNYALTSNEVLTHYLAAGIAPNNIQVSPSSQDADIGGTVTFSADVAATAPLSYFWTDQDNDLLSTNSSLTLNDVQPGSYNYNLLVTNLYGQASSSASLNVYSGAVSVYSDLSTTPLDVPPGTTVNLTVGMYGTPPITYQWFLNDTNAIPGATNASYTFLASIGTNTYSVAGTNQAGASTAMSSDATVIGTTSIGFGSSVGWTLNGGATLTGSPLALTVSDENANAALTSFNSTPQNIDGFLATFTYTALVGTGLGNGATFCLQNSASGATARGGNTTSLGYNGIHPSVALEIDLTSGPGGPGINWETNGVTAETGGIPNGRTSPVSVTNQDPINFTIYYNYLAGELDVNLTDTNANTTFSTNYLVGDLSATLGTNMAYVGFTGSGTAVQTIGNFTFTYTTEPFLTVNRAEGSVSVTWPETITSSFILQQSGAVNGPWSNVETPPTPDLANAQYQVTISPTNNAQFYRLILPNP